MCARNGKAGIAAPPTTIPWPSSCTGSIVNPAANAQFGCTHTGPARILGTCSLNFARIHSSTSAEIAKLIPICDLLKSSIGLSMATASPSHASDQGRGLGGWFSLAILIRNRKASLTDSASGKTSATSDSRRMTGPAKLLRLGPSRHTPKIRRSCSGRSSSIMSFGWSIAIPPLPLDR